ncbi:voltage-gated potassium channel [Paraperlucidibaca baekdonensis]|uniref:Voltage-gated potassium channel n=1 Tax=Paraperlucidibaca baekdonensis TaxID=748120 RepID=A0A3E0H804_9GAMM|nr:potassium channel protein [Paraperlucidibaca baekdonensis]REH39868.1 voltage-gated potassium channel [Paraperlucidibaca baekdonensis]
MMMKPPGRTQKLRKRLFVKSEHSPEQVLLRRIGLIVGLISLVLLIFWIDRDGLRDQIDGHVSFSDIAYFTAVTITTVGYGDIVPVSDRARIVDTILVTPLRLFIWFIFLGTAYELVLQRWLETRRMTRLQKSLRDHVIICGYGHSGESAAREALSRGTPMGQVLIIDQHAEHLKRAAEHGHIGLLGDATSEEILRDAGVDNAKAVLICLGRDDAAVLTVLTTRHLNADVRIIASVNEEENIKIIRQAGADAIVAPSIVGGYLMADSVDSTFVADYINDLMQSDGRVRLIERAVRPDEIGKRMRELGPNLVVRVHRDGERIGFWEDERAVIEPNDRLLEIEPNHALDGA